MKWIVVWCFVVVVVVGGPERRINADLILHDGVIWTVDEKNPTVQAVAIKGLIADLTVLSKNLLKIVPKDYLTTDVLYTIIDGKIVYNRSA